MSRTWIVYKSHSVDAEGWEQRRLMPSSAGTDILWENWDYSDKEPCIGDRTRDYENLSHPGDGITHGKEGDWVVVQIDHFSSSSTDDRIIICYCEYQPVDSEWRLLNRGLPIDQVLQSHQPV